MERMRKKIVRLAKMIGGVPGKLTVLTSNSPEYYALASVVTDEQADVALVAGLRKVRTLEYLSRKCGKSLEETTRLAYELADEGVFTMWKDKGDGKERISVEIFAPGTLERMVGNRKQLAEHPEIARAFNEYTAGLGEKLAATLPMGTSLMRVIPVEKAIDGNPQVVEWERLSYYLDKYDTYSVSDCSCRASRRILGEGCGHLEKDMCLHLGPSAEYYAETGKARYVTKEEALALLKRAEDNGLMHSIPNITDPGETNAICNCCACSCFGLRIGLMYGAREAISSNYVAKIDEEKCVACGICVENCPGQALLMGQKIHSVVGLKGEKPYKKITNSKWTAEDWDVDYRTNRVNTVCTGTSPCKVACPAHIAVQGYLKLASMGRYRDALELIKEENPFPAVCGRICNHRCETECTRSSLDEAVAIDEVKRFIADQDLNEEHRYVPPMINQTGKPFEEKIAIIGSGPAGMSCAYFLAKKGYKPVVFEKRGKIGGMLMNGIPSFRLQKDVVQAEIDILKEMGVEFRPNVEVGKDVTIDKLKEEGYKAFYVAIGAQGGRKVNVPGENSDGVRSGIDFLYDVNAGKEVELRGNTIIIGGGNVAIDVARTALRINKKGQVGIYCLEAMTEVPASPDEVAEAGRDGLLLNCGWGPKEILTIDGKVSAVIFKRCVSVFDENHKFNPKYDENDVITVECGSVLLAIGQSIEWGNLLDGQNVEMNPNNTIKADPKTFVTSNPMIFAGGDAQSGPKFAIDAIAAGKQAAISIHRAVHEGQSLVLGRDNRIFTAIDKNLVDYRQEGFDRCSRQIPVYDQTKEKTFSEARLAFTPEQIKQETARCLKCGATKVDEYKCIGCGQCTTKCKFEAITLEKRPRTAWGVSFEKLPIAVARHVVKRTGTILANKFGRKG